MTSKTLGLFILAFTLLGCGPADLNGDVSEVLDAAEDGSRKHEGASTTVMGVFDDAYRDGVEYGIRLRDDNQSQSIKCSFAKAKLDALAPLGLRYPQVLYIRGQLRYRDNGRAYLIKCELRADPQRSERSESRRGPL